MISRISTFSGPLSPLFSRVNSQSVLNLILDLQSTLGLSGSTWIDQSSYNNNATLYGTIATASIDSGVIVLSLDGTDDYIFPTGGFGNILDTGLTYEIWACPGTSSNGVLLLETGQSVTNSGWNDNQIAFMSNHINATVYDNDTNPYINGPTFSVDTWYNIVMTYNNSNDLVSLYIDGDLYSTLTVNKANPSNTYLSLGRPGTATLYLGGSTGYFKGYIGSWRIWDGPLDSTQILSNYNDLKSIYVPPIQLLLNSNFDNGATNWTATGGFAAYSFTSSNQVAVLNGVLYFTYVSRTVSQSVTVSDIISSVNTFTGVLNIKRIENGPNNNDTYSFVLLFKNSAGTTIATKTTGTVIAPQNFTDISLVLNRSEISGTFNDISSVQVNITGIDAGFWNGNHGPMVDYVTLTVS